MSYAARHSKSKAAEDWAAKRRAAMDRAKKLREERKRGLVSDDHTFKPATTPYEGVSSRVMQEQHGSAAAGPIGGDAGHHAPFPGDGGYSNGDAPFPGDSAYGGQRRGSGRNNELYASGDSLDAAARNSRGGNRTSPRAGGHAIARNESFQRIAQQNRKIPSPGSDALTYEVRRYGGDDAAASAHREDWSAGGHAPGFQPAPTLHGHARPRGDDHGRGHDHHAAPPPQQQDDANEVFLRSLRGDEPAPARHGSARRRRQPKRPEWNNDFAGDAAPAPSSTEPSRPSGGSGSGGTDYVARMREELSQQERLDAEQSVAVAPVPSRRRARGRVDDRPAWNSDFADDAAPASADPEHAARPAAVRGSAGGGRRGRGRLISASEITGQGASGDGGEVPPQRAASQAAQYHSQQPARPQPRRSASAMDANAPGTMADLKHQVAKPKLSLLKKKLKSRRSLRRMQSGSNVTAPAPPADRHLPAADDRGYGDYDAAGGASSYGQPASRQTYQDRGGYGQRRSNPTPSPEPPAAPTRHPPRAGSSSSSSSHRGRRGSRGSPQQRQQDLHRHDPYDDGASRRGGLRHSPPPAGAPVARRRAAAPAVPGGRVVATECTRQQGCQCAACAAADAAVDMPAPIPAEVEIERVACPDCGRKFSREALSRHAGVCKKVFLTKRKKFNSTAARVAGTEAAKFVKGANDRGRGRRRGAGRDGARSRQRARSPPVGGAAAAKKAKWKAKSSAFRDAMRAAREYKAAKAAGIDPPPIAASAPDPSFVPCPNCGRTFNEKAAERHIPRCKNIIAKPKRLIRGSGGAGGRRTASAAPAPAPAPTRTGSTRMSRAPSGRRAAPTGARTAARGGSARSRPTAGRARLSRR